MKPPLISTAVFALAVFFVLPMAAADHWEIQYRYRQVDSTLSLNDMAFPDAKHGIACGYTTDRKDKVHPLVLLTNNAGDTWTEVPGKEACLSMFFLDDGTGWMVTDAGIWTTEEAGRNWTKLKTSPTNILRLWFLDRQHGFAAGREKHVFETKDGGTTWTPLAAATNAPGSPTYTTYGDINFSGKKGLISGWNIPPSRGGPDWMETDRAKAEKQVPHLSILLQTHDSGATWVQSEASLFGQITRISLSPQAAGLGLVEFKDQFDYPSEVYKIDTATGLNTMAFRAKDRAITDVRLFPGSSTGLIVGYETSGPVYRSPIPGKLKVLRSDDLLNWTEMEVDYRAVAHGALITGPDDKHVWIATDTGMILKLVQ